MVEGIAPQAAALFYANLLEADPALELTPQVSAAWSEAYGVMACVMTSASNV